MPKPNDQQPPFATRDPADLLEAAIRDLLSASHKIARLAADQHISANIARCFVVDIEAISKRADALMGSIGQ